MATSDGPHILVFLTDDHGQWAMPAYGNREILAPNMDYLATSGVRMANAYTPCPVCSPARASFFTGRLPSQHGIHDWLRETEHAHVHPGIDDQTTIAQLLHEKGYYTGLVGKWHCARSWQPKPGFDEWFSYQVAQYPHFGEQRFSEQGEPITQHGHQSALLTDRAITFLRNRPPDNPFFLFIGYVNTHGPHKDQPERLVSRYRSASFEDIPDETFDECHGTARNVWEHAAETHREQLAQYYAAVTMIDDQIGRVLDELDAQGILNDTLVVYTSDHGLMTGHHGLPAKGNATVPQNFLEESIRVPCLLSWPAKLEKGQVREEMVDHCDLFQTLLDAAGVAMDEPTSRTVHSPGTSYLPLLRGERTAWRDALFCEYGNARMIRTATHKLIRRYPGPNGQFPDELYDLVDDPRERINRIDDAAYRPLVRELGERLDVHFAEYEIPERSGREIERQPRCNPNEPWLTPPRTDG